MSALKGKDIFNAVYTYVRASYIDNLYSKKVKSHTASENVSEEENNSMAQTSEPTSETGNSTRTVTGTNSETVSETVERMSESEVADKIRLDIDEKFTFALASVCSNLATIDRDYRLLKGLPDQPTFSEYAIENSDTFPLCDRFVFPAVMFVSSMVLIDIDEKRSDDYYDKYASSVTQIISELPRKIYRTIEKYPY